MSMKRVCSLVGHVDREGVKIGRVCGLEGCVDWENESTNREDMMIGRAC